MTIRAAVANVFGLQTTEEIARAQLDALKMRVPYLYAILAINVFAVYYTRHDTNPMWQVVVLPLALVGALVSRMIWWAKLKTAMLTIAKVRHILRVTVWLGGALGAAMLAWAISLHRSDAVPVWPAYMTSNGDIDFFVGITVCSCIFLLMHLRLAAIVVGLIVVGPFALYLLETGRAAETAIALNLILVTAAMLYVAVSFARDFERMVTNASDLSRLSSQNACLAASDAMTGLPNRRQFFWELEQAAQGTPPFAVILIDLDGFKHVNDVYGHNAGDDVLRVVANNLHHLVPADCCVSRLGGDEFACLLIGSYVENAQAIALSIIAACSMPIVRPSFTANIGASAGICLSQSVPDDLRAVYERADYALFEAKRAGRGRVARFSGEHDQSIRRHSCIAQLLRSADLCSELSLVYQPVFAAGIHSITSFEALLRWTSQELGPVEPKEFIQIAERTDLIFAISQHVLRTALIQAATWPEAVCLKVNLSVRDLMSRTQTEALLEQIRKSAVHPTRVTLEVTETIFAESLDIVRSNVDIFRLAGCKIAIDDFGVGYSNLNYIHALLPDVIKIDRSFVDVVDSDNASQGIIRTIIELARNVGAKSVAEGVETLAQSQLLAELGCDELQGYYFSRPVLPETAADMVAHIVPHLLPARLSAEAA